MVQAFYRRLVLTLMTWFSPRRVMFMVYTNGLVAGYSGWVEVRGFGMVAFVKPDGRYQFRWKM